MPLADLEQTDWAAGAFQGVARHLIPANGLFALRNGLYDDDGLIYGRGGTVNLSNRSLNRKAGRFLWAGHLDPGERIVFADAIDFGVLDSDGHTPLNLLGAGMPEAKRAVEIGGILFIGGGILYAGSRKSADYSVGTVSTVNGSKTVTGSGTLWSANVDAGMLLRVGGAGRYYVVASVDSNTQITLRDTYQGATAGAQAYALTRLGSTATAPYRTSDFYVAVANRLLSLEGARVYISDYSIPDPADAASGQGAHKWLDSFSAPEYHELPEGVRITGGWDIGAIAFIFTTRGTFALQGLDMDLTDTQGNVQQRLEHAYPDLVLWSNAGIATYQQALVVPATDTVWLVDGVHDPVPIADSISDLYRPYVEAGYKTGLGAVYRGHYLLPVLTAANEWIDTLVCRLDRPIRARRQAVRAWSELIGSGAQAIAYAVRVGSPVPDPQLLAIEAAFQTTFWDDTFDVDSLSSYTWDTGSAADAAVTGGALVPSTTGVAREFYRPGHIFEDSELVAEVAVGSGDSTAFEGRIKRLDASNGIVAGIRADANLLQIRKKDAGVFTTLATKAVTFNASTVYWIVPRIEGNRITVEAWNGDPDAAGVLIDSLSYDLAGADATKFGAGVQGTLGLRWTVTTGDWQIRTLRARAPRGRIVDASGYFSPSVAVKLDADRSELSGDLTTRDYELGAVATQTKKMRLEYELEQTQDAPTITAGYNSGAPNPEGAEWGIDYWDGDSWTDKTTAAEFLTLEGAAPVDMRGETPYEWPVNTRVRRIRFRFSWKGAVSLLRIVGVRTFLRPTRRR